MSTRGTFFAASNNRMASAMLMLMVGIAVLMVEQTQALSFTCFLEKTEKSCYQGGGMYCSWAKDKKECDLSPFSLMLLCKYDKVEQMCVQARDACGQLAEDRCTLQTGVCQWGTDGKCSAVPGDITLEELLENQQRPGDGDNSSGGGDRDPDSTIDDPRSCCDALAPICTKDGDMIQKPNPAAQRKLLRKARNSCGFRSHKRLCAYAKKNCAA